MSLIPSTSDLSKISDFWTKFSPDIKFNEDQYEAAIVDCILKNTYYIIRKDRRYEIKFRPFDWSLLVNYELIEALRSSEYPCVTLKYK